MNFVSSMQSKAGRAARVVAGLALIGIGISVGGAGLVLVAIGLVPLAAGASGICLLAPLVHAPLRQASHK